MPLPSAEPFVLPGSPDHGALLVHGFTGGPYEMRFLGEVLHREHGLTVSAVRLAGHGGTVEQLSRVRWLRWLESLEEGLARLEGRCRRVHLVGFSMGGALALIAASRDPARLCSLTLLSTVLWLPARVQLSLELMGRLGAHRQLDRARRTLGFEPRSAWQRKTASVGATLQLLEAARRARAVLEQVQVPTLVLHSRRDPTVPFACSTELVRRLPDARRVVLRESFHVITQDVERDRVAAEVGAFIRARGRCCAGGR